MNVCTKCNDTFVPKWKHAKFCSQACRWETYDEIHGMAIGATFGNLTIIGREIQNGPNRLVRVQCICGSVRDVFRNTLTKGNIETRSCGCVKAANQSKRMTVHGAVGKSHVNASTYASWKAMKARCTNPKSPYWHVYGGIGITVCARWQLSFAAFLEDMGPRPSKNYSIDRIDVDGNYEPGNCRWATAIEQGRNKRHNRILEWRGESMCLTELALRYHVHPVVLHNRLKRGVSLEMALSIPSKSINILKKRNNANL